MRREQRVCFQSNESVGRAFSPEASPFELAASGGFCATAYSWLKSRSATNVDFLTVGLVMGPKRRRIESGKKLVSVSANGKKMFQPVRLPPRAFCAVLVCVYVALHDVLSYAMTYSHKPHHMASCISVC